MERPFFGLMLLNQPSNAVQGLLICDQHPERTEMRNPFVNLGASLTHQTRPYSRRERAASLSQRGLIRAPLICYNKIDVDLFLIWRLKLGGSQPLTQNARRSQPV